MLGWLLFAWSICQGLWFGVKFPDFMEPLLRPMRKRLGLPQPGEYPSGTKIDKKFKVPYGPNSWGANPNP